MPDESNAVMAENEYSDEEKTLIIQYFTELRKDYITQFLSDNQLARNGTKEQLIENIESYLVTGQITYASLVRFLNDVTPLGKQHVYLYKGPERLIDTWRDPNQVNEIFRQRDLRQYTERDLSLFLPEQMAITRIIYEPERRLSIAAVERRDHLERV